jgi:hypothetical protein
MFRCRGHCMSLMSGWCSSTTRARNATSLWATSETTPSPFQKCTVGNRLTPLLGRYERAFKATILVHTSPSPKTCTHRAKQSSASWPLRNHHFERSTFVVVASVSRFSRCSCGRGCTLARSLILALRESLSKAYLYGPADGCPEA